MGYEENLNGKVPVQGEIIPDGGSTVQPVVKNRYVKGSPKSFTSIADAVELHPNLMEFGTPINIVDAPENGVLKITEFILQVDPATMFDPQTLESFLTEDNWLDYFVARNTLTSNFSRVQEYAPSAANGAKPPFPYTSAAGLAFESNWTPIKDASLNHKWFRFRDDDVDDNVDGIFDNWTPPISIGSSILEGDFIANLYARQNVTATVAVNQGQLVATDLPSGDSGWFQVTVGNIDVDDGTTVTNLTIGRYFKFNGGYTYTFNASASATQVLPPPPTNISASSNDAGNYEASSGLDTIVYTDTIPAGTDDLWEIISQKSVYGALKSDWVISRLLEDPSLTRYATNFTALPSTVCATDEDAGINPFDADLEAIGWYGAFILDATYLATRDDLGGGNFSAWTIKKIAGESGEYKDRVFKLFPINTDFDTETPPASADALSEGWSDTPLAETATEINGVTESTKYFDGTLKVPWSVPVAYTGMDSYNDVIATSFGNTFKYDPNSATPSVAVPTDITLEAQLYKGISPLWYAETITYVWTRIYNNGIDTTIADADTGKNFYYLGTAGTAGQPDYKRDGQRLFVTAAAVDGRAVFECVQTLTLPDASTVVFTDEFSIDDLTDGIDSKSLDAKADIQALFYNTSDLEFSVDEVRISSFVNNLPTGFALFWYEETAPSTWTKLTSGVGGYTYSAENYGGQLQIETSVVFTADGSLESKRYASSNIDGDPTTSDNITTFVDYVTVTKADSSATAVDGTPSSFAVLTNESHVIVVDDQDIAPVSGEIGASGQAKTLIEVYDGETRVVQGAGSGEYLVTALVSSNGNITPAQQVSGTDVELYISAWTDGERSTNITATIEYVTGDARGTITLTKIFSVNSTLDAAGAILMSIDSDDGRLSFYPENLTDIDLTANVYNDTQTPPLEDPADYYFSWKVGIGSWETVKAGGGGTLGEQRAVTRAEIRTNGLVEVRVFEVAVPSIPNDILRSNAIEINDVQDGQTFRLYQTDAEPYSEPSAPSPTIDPAVGDGSWIPSATDAVWVVEGTQDPYADWAAEGTPEYTWGDVYQLKGVTGGDGNQGGGYYSMYSIYDNGAVKPTFPSGNTSTIDQMIAGVGQEEWETTIPSATKIWRTERLYQGYTATSSTVKLDAGGKLVGGDDSAAEPITGSVWADPILLVDDNAPQGNFREVRYQGSVDGNPTTFVNSNRQAGTGWSVLRPAITSANYILETYAYIDPDDDSLQGTWSTPVIIDSNAAEGNDTEVLFNSSGIRAASANLKFDGTTLELAAIETDNELTQVVVFDIATKKFKVMDMTAIAGNQKYCTLIRSAQANFDVDENIDNVVPVWDDSDESETGFTKNLTTGIITSSLKGKGIMTLYGKFYSDEASSPPEGDMTVKFFKDGLNVYEVIIPRVNINGEPIAADADDPYFELDITTNDFYTFDDSSHDYQIKVEFPDWTSASVRNLADASSFPVNFSLYFENAIE